MPLNDLNRDRELRPASILLGHVRLGVFEGKHPRQADTFVFTSSDPNRLEPLRADYGGEVERYEPQGAGTEPWRLVSTADVITALFPFGSVSENAPQHWELWTASGLKRQCDGYRCTVVDVDEVTGEREETEHDCLCEQGGSRECSPISRLMLFFPQTGFGIWQLQTGSKIAATALHDQMSFLASIAGVMLNRVPIRLTYAPRKITYFDAKEQKRRSATKRIVSLSIASDVEGTLRALGMAPQQSLISAIRQTLAASGRELRILESGEVPSARALEAGGDGPAERQDPDQAAGRMAPAAGAPAPSGSDAGEGDPAPVPPPASAWEEFQRAQAEASFSLGDEGASTLVRRFWRERKLGPPRESWAEEHLVELARLLRDAAAAEQQQSLGVGS